MKIRDQVKAFHEKFGIVDPVVPCVPGSDKIRLRVKLILEEYIELLEALGFDKLSVIYEHEAEVCSWIPDPEKVDLVEVADALGDIDYLTEGARLTFGINGESIANEIQRTNMNKEGGSRRSDGKITKPIGWTGPKIRECLIEQGWIDNNNGKEENNDT